MLSAHRFETLAWVFIYAGIAVACVGVALLRQPVDHAWAVIAAGALGVATGTCFIWMRSRMPDAPPSRSPTETP